MVFGGKRNWIDYNDLSVTLPPSFSVCSWVRFDLLGTWSFPFSNDYVGTLGNDLALWIGVTGAGTYFFGFWGDDLDSGFSAVPDIGTWRYLTFTFDATIKDRRIYRDGALIGQGFSNGVFVGGNGAFLVGTSAQSLYPFTGALDEVRVYARALTPSEIRAQFYHNVFADGDRGPILYLPFTGGSINDFSGQGRIGTFAPSPYPFSYFSTPGVCFGKWYRAAVLADGESER
jgi:hypothetical protein